MATSIDDNTCAKMKPILEEITAQFFQMVPIRRIKWRTLPVDATSIGTEMQLMFLDSTLNHPTCLSYPPSLNYRRAFLKQLLHILEEAEIEVCDEMYETYADLLQEIEEEDDTLCYKTYFLPGGSSVSLKESVHLVSQGTTGLCTWQASLHLVEWIIEHKDVFDNKTILELGSGLGLTGLALCKYCNVKSFTFSDFHEQVLYLLMHNIETNFIENIKSHKFHHMLPSPSSSLPHNDIAKESHKDRMMQSIRKQLSVSSEVCNPCTTSMGSEIMEISYQSTGSTSQVEEEGSEVMGRLEESVSQLSIDGDYWTDKDGPGRMCLSSNDKIHLLKLDWESPKEDVFDKISADIVIAADVVYDKTIIPSLTKVLKKFLCRTLESGQKPMAYIASTIRNEDTRDRFLVSLGNEGLTYRRLDPPSGRIFHYEDTIPTEIMLIQQNCP